MILAVAASAATVFASAPAEAHWRGHVMDRDLLSGVWVRSAGEACAEAYPERIEMQDLGIYAAPGAVDAGKLWHSGDWELEGGVLKMQAANDAMLPYRIAALSGGEMVLLDADGCRIVYRKA